MPRLRKTTAKNVDYYSIIEDYYRNGKRTTKTLITIGSDKKINNLAKEEGITLNAWLNNYLVNYLKEFNETSAQTEVIIKKNSNKLIPKNVINKYNVGYLFLKDIYYSLKLDQIIKTITKKY